MFDTDKFLDLVENHHHVGGLNSTDCKNFCLVGSVYVGYGFFDFQTGDVVKSAVHKVGESDFYRALEKTVREHSGKDYIEVATFNDSGVEHDEIVEVAKKAVSLLSY